MNHHAQANQEWQKLSCSPCNRYPRIPKTTFKNGLLRQPEKREFLLLPSIKNESRVTRASLPKANRISRKDLPPLVSSLGRPWGDTRRFTVDVGALAMHPLLRKPNQKHGCIHGVFSPNTAIGWLCGVDCRLSSRTKRLCRADQNLPILGSRLDSYS